MAGLFALVASTTLTAQSVIWKDDFEGDKGWQTFEYKGQYKAEYTKDGALLLKANDDNIRCISRCKTNLNPTKNFSISVDATSKSGLRDDSYFGIAFNCLDKKNYSIFCIEKGFAYFLEYRDGELKRHDWDVIKKTKDKTFTLEIKKTGSTAVFVVNDEETIFMEKIEVESSKIGLFVQGKTQVAFDNLVIKQ